jgi:PAS domain S-box-containing protein
VERLPSALFRRLFESAPYAVLVVDEGGLVVVANERCREVLGVAPAELVGTAAERVVETEPGSRRSMAVRPDTTPFLADVEVTPLGADAPGLTAISVRDVTAQVREEERFRALLEAAPDPTVIVDADGTVVLANDRLHAVFGYTRDEVVGQGVDVLAPEATKESTRTGFASYVASPTDLVMGTIQEELVALHRDGTIVPVEISMSPLWTEDGLLVSMALRDMRERQHIQAESQRLRDELIATVSHELRTPLTSIIGYAELLADLDEPDLSRRARKLLGVIERNALRELQLVDDLLTMAYLDDDRIRLTVRPVDLVVLCRSVVDDLRLRARERGLELVVVDEAVAPVRGDHRRLVQVVENLVGNAIKFTQPGGRVEVQVREAGAMGIVEVRDTGIGVDPEEKARLFERLYRARGAIELQAQGAGLGLSIVRAIVEAHGGWVDIESEVGVGTVVGGAGPPHTGAAPRGAGGTAG